jgi:hypothetical protein
MEGALMRDLKAGDEATDLREEQSDGIKDAVRR